jgi:UPF0042 nucleotide-binding protein
MRLSKSWLEFVNLADTMTAETIIITGLSGAGKNTALRIFEDQSYYCIDNLPFFLISDLLEKKGADLQKLALVMDGRDKTFFTSWPKAFTALRQQQANLKLIFLEADDDVLLRRFSQVRRPHPLEQSGSVRQGIEAERKELGELRAVADLVIDTSALAPRDLRRELLEYCGGSTEGQMRVHLLSFGFKNGSPPEADIVWDVRFLPNPYYVPELKNLTGLDDRVADYVLNNGITTKFMELLQPLVSFLIPQFEQEGKADLTIAVGCTGGKHRSVVIARQLRQIFISQGIRLSLSHRDLGRE